MKKSTFNIRTNEGGLVEKTGYRFTYPDYPGYEFAVHQEGNCINSDKHWIVTELSTGLGFCSNWRKGKTRKVAIQQAKEILKKVGKTALRDYIAGTINRHHAVISGRAN